MTRTNDDRPHRDGTYWRTYVHHRYAVLFFSLLFMLVVVPTADAVGVPQLAIKLLIAGCLVAAVMPNANKHTRYGFLAAILALIAVRFASERDEVPIDFGLMQVLYGLTGLLAAAGALRFVIRSPRVDSETVFAALSTYLLAGLFFGVFYSAIEYVQPGSFTGPDEFNQANAIYYSFVTLATLGYGDFLPKSGLARGIATFEVIGGQLYLAVMVARLIGVFDAKQDGA